MRYNNLIINFSNKRIKLTSVQPHFNLVETDVYGIAEYHKPNSAESNDGVYLIGVMELTGKHTKTKIYKSSKLLVS